MTTAPETSGRGATGVAAMVMLTLGALLSLGYAGWAFTARRGIFADFADGNAVSVDDAESSDTIDTFFLIAAGVVALLALVLWIVRKAGKQTSGGALDLTGLALAAVGVVTVAVGLFLASGVPDADGQAAQGDKGVLAALVTGAGFAVLAIGLLVGIFAVRGSKQAGSNGYAPGPTPGYQNW
ncbi:MAG: hypothetical protein H0U28_10170 [Nocardioidaceae bacterium]|nr:hypothetical protein [Nocardioidaceae bacterium]